VLGFFKVVTTPLFGLDISTSSVKVVQLSNFNGKYIVEAYGVELLPPQSVVDRSIKDIEKVSEAIRRLVNRTGINRKFAAIAVAGSSVITRVIQMNATLDETEIVVQIQTEADRYIPYPLEEVYYDYEILGSYQKNTDFVDVLLAAARIETIELKRTVVTASGLKATVVDVESLAIEKAFALAASHLPHSELIRHVALIDIGSTNTDIYVFQNLQTVYNRSQAFGGKHLSDEIQRRYGLSEAEAIAAQKYGGLPEDYITEVLNPFKETVVQQINRALQVYFSSTEDAQINFLALAGGVGLLPGLDALVQSKLGVKTFIANPFAEMQVAKGLDKNILLDEGPTLMMACGLALRNFT
jgi:type IV pilus assembly protein PilM